MRGAALAAAAVLVAGTALPATGVTPGLDTARRDLDEAERELGQLERAVRRTVNEIAALDQRLLEASTELARVREELARAEEELEAARVVERHTAAELASVDAELDAVLAGWVTRRDRLSEHAVHAYKRGRNAHLELLVGGVVGAADWHEIAVTLEAVGRLVEDERSLADDAVTRTRDTAVLRAEVGASRSRALAAAQDAAREQRRVERLLARQEALVAAIEEELEARTVILSELEADAESRAALVRELRRQVAALELARATALVEVDLDLDLDGPPPAWAAALPPAGGAYAPAIHAVAARHGLDGRLLAAVVWAESGFRADAVSHGGAVGLAQLMPATARGLGVNPYDPVQNLDGGARYLRTQLDRFGSVELALAAYNAGPGRVAAAGGVPAIVETQVYVVNVLDRYADLVGFAE